MKVRHQVGAVMATAALALGLPTGAAVAKKSSWSQAKCSKSYSSWAKKHKNATSSQVTKELKKLKKKHGCVLQG